jgi:hypothetical protein
MHLILDIDATLADVGNASVDPPKDGSPPWWLNPDVLALMQPLRPVWWAVEGLLNKYAMPLIVVTGRNEAFEDLTRDWLVRTAAEFGMDDEMRDAALFMRKSADRRASHIVKEEILATIRERGFDPKVAFEDRNDDAEMYRRNGLFVFQTADKGYVKPAKVAVAVPKHAPVERSYPTMSLSGPLA